MSVYLGLCFLYLSECLSIKKSKKGCDFSKCNSYKSEPDC